MKFKQFWADAKSKAKAMSGVDAVKSGFFGGTGIGKSLEKLANCDAGKRKTYARESAKVITDYQKLVDGKETQGKLNPKQKTSIEALSVPLGKMKKLLTDFSEDKITWEELDFAYEKGDEDKQTEDGGKGVVVSIDPTDKVIHEATHDITKGRKMGQDKSLTSSDKDKDKGYSDVHADPKLEEADFSKAGSNAPIVLLAHGSTPIFKSSKGNVQAVEFGGKSPSVMIDYIKKTLPLEYSGVVYLDGCFTGAGQGPLVYADQVYKGLVKAGYKYLQIKGNLGAATTTHDGRELVTPADVDQYKEDLTKRRNTFKKAFDTLMSKYEDERKVLNEKIAAAKDSAEKKELAKEFKTIQSREEADQGIQQAAARMNELSRILTEEKDSKGKPIPLKIEALTGTWGPEALPPKK